MALRMIDTQGAKLQTESFGEPTSPPVLLIMGVMASMLWWPEAFCRRLADAGHFVIRYDNRDTGLSTTYPPGAPGYSFADMAEDAVAILDGYGIEAAHVVGMSMGGMIAQEVALKHPARIRTLTLISTSPVGIDGLPPMTEAYQAHSETGEQVDWSQRASVIDFIARDAAMLAGSRHPHDAASTRRFIEADYDRASSFASVTNHFMLMDGGGSLHASGIVAPLLVIHGTADPIFPVEHGEAFTSAVANATLMRVEGGGHEIHAADIAAITEAIERHAAAHRNL